MARSKKNTKKTVKKASAKKFVFVVDNDWFDVSSAGTEKQIVRDAEEAVEDGFNEGDAVVYELVPRYRISSSQVVTTKLV
jgi:hypothetical protein